MKMKLLSFAFLLFMVYSCASNKPFVKESIVTHITDTIRQPGQVVKFTTLVHKDFDTTIAGANYTAYITYQNDSLAVKVNVVPTTNIIYKTIEKKDYSTISIEKKNIVIGRKIKLDSLKNIINKGKIIVSIKKDSLKFNLRKFKVTEHAPSFFGRIWLKIKDYLLFLSLIINGIFIFKSIFSRLINKIM